VNNPRGYSLQNIIVARSCRLHDETVNAHLFTHLHLSFDLVLVLFIALKLSWSSASALPAPNITEIYQRNTSLLVLLAMLDKPI